MFADNAANRSVFTRRSFGKTRQCTKPKVTNLELSNTCQSGLQGTVLYKPYVDMVKSLVNYT